MWVGHGREGKAFGWGGDGLRSNERYHEEIIARSREQSRVSLLYVPARPTVLSVADAKIGLFIVLIKSEPPLAASQGD